MIGKFMTTQRFLSLAANQLDKAEKEQFDLISSLSHFIYYSLLRHSFARTQVHIIENWRFK
jgi:hypothetical protein